MTFAHEDASDRNAQDVRADRDDYLHGSTCLDAEGREVLVVPWWDDPEPEWVRIERRYRGRRRDR